MSKPRKRGKGNGSGSPKVQHGTLSTQRPLIELQAVTEGHRASRPLHRIQWVMVFFLANGRMRWYDDADFKFEDT